jgi:phosphatidylglycerol:prolipoprotein diacylglycerol transferase
MLTYPHIGAVALHLGTLHLPIVGTVSLDLRWYALAYLTGVLGGWWLVSILNKRLSPPTLNKTAFDDIMVWAILGIVLGGRFGYILFYKPEFYFTHPAEMLKVWEGGMSFHGGLLGTIIAMVIFARQYTIPFLAITDLLAPAAPIGLCLGRLANFINGELWGRVTHGPLGMIFPESDGQPRYPSQLFEASLEGVVLFCVLLTIALRTRALERQGLLSGLFLIGYAIARSFCELFREPDDFLGFFPGHLTMGQLLCLPMLIIGIYLVLRSRRAQRL